MYQNILDQTWSIDLALKTERTKTSKLSEVLRRKRRVWIIGMGSSLLAAKVAVRAYEELLPWYYQAKESTDILEYETRPADRCDLAIVVSQSGESFDTVSAAEKLVKSGVEVWALTNNGESRLAHLANEVLLLHAGDEVGSATKTFTSTLALLYLLALVASDNGGDSGVAGSQVRNNWTEAGKLGAYVTEVLKQSEPITEWAERLRGANQIILLGLGPHRYVAQESALMIQEKARILAVGMSGAEFIHGPLEVVEPGLPIVFIQADDASGSVLGQVAQRVGEFGAETFGLCFKVVWEGFGNGSDAESKVKTEYPFHHKIDLILRAEASIGAVLGLMTPLFVTIPFQLLAYHMATKKGFNPDTFRYIGKIQTHY